MKSGKAAILVFFLCFAGVQGIWAAEFYLLPEVIGTTESPKIGSFVVAGSGRQSEEISALLEKPIMLPIESAAIISGRMIRKIIGKHYSKPFAVIGSYTAYIPYELWKKNRAEAKEALLGIGRVLDNNGMAGYSTAEWVLYNDGELKGYQQFYMITGRVAAGDPVRKGDLSVIYKPADEVKSPISEQDIADGIEAVSYLSGGTVLTETNTRKHRIVNSGERIKIVVRKKSITIRLEGIAYESGAIGDVVKVKPVQSEKKLYGKITGPREVRVDWL